MIRLYVKLAVLIPELFRITTKNSTYLDMIRKELD